MASSQVTIIGSVPVETGSITNEKISANAAIQRSKLKQDTFQTYGITPTMLRVWDNLASLLPGTASADDLAIIEGTLGTDFPVVQTSDSKATSVTQYARFLFTLPPEYDAAESIRCTIRGAMNTTVSDGTATVDLECYAHDEDGSVGSDLVTTSAQSINSLTHADFDFDITSSGRSAGDQLDLRIKVDITDSATGTAVIGELSKVAMKLDIRG